MADETVKKLLIKLGISTKDWQTAVGAIKKDLTAFNKQQEAAHEKKKKQADAEIALEKKKQEQAKHQLKVLDEQIEKVKKLQNLASKQPEKLAQLIKQEKDLLAVKSAQVRVMERDPKFKQANLKFLHEEVATEKAKLNLIEARARMNAAAQTGKKPPAAGGAATTGVDTSAAKLAALDSQLQAAQRSAAMQSVRFQQADVEEAYRKGAIKTKQYIEQRMALEQRAHALRMAAIQQEKAGHMSALQVQLNAGKMTLAEARKREEIIETMIKNRIAMEQRAYQQAQRNLQATGAKKSGMGGIATKAMSFVGNMTGLGALPVQMMAAVAAGNLLFTVLEKVATKVKSVLAGTSAEMQVYEQFEKLSKGRGEDPTAFAKKMKAATRGMVDDIHLYRIANNYMQSGVKATSDQIANLTKYTVALSRAQGRDATQAVQSLTRAAMTGRTQMLAFVTGIDRTAIATRGIPQTLDAASRKTLEFTNVLEAMEKRYKEVGEPALTFNEILQIGSTQVGEFFDSLAFGIAGSSAFQELIKGLGIDIVNVSEKAQEWGAIIGQYIGDAFVVVKPLIEVVWEALKTGWEVLQTGISLVKTFYGMWSQVIAFFAGDEAASSFSGFFDKLLSLRGILGTVAQVIYFVVDYFRKLSATMRMVGAITAAVAKGDLAAAKQAWKEYGEEVNKITDETFEKLAKLEEWKEGKDKAKEVKAATTEDPEAKALKEKLHALDIQLAELASKRKVELAVMEASTRQRLAKQEYEDGLANLQAFAQKRRQILEKEYKAKIAGSFTEQSGKISEIQYQVSQNKMVQEEANKQIALIQRQFELQRLKERQSYNEQLAAIDRELHLDTINAERAYLDASTAMYQESSNFRKDIAEDEFKKGRLTIEEYLATRRALVEEEISIEERTLQEKIKRAQDNKVEQAKLVNEMFQLQVKRERELTAITRQEHDIRLQQIQQRYDLARQLVEKEMSLSENRGDYLNTDGASRMQGLEALFNLSQAHVANLNSEMERLEKTGETYSDQWYKVREGIIDATLEQRRLNEEMIRAKDILSPAGGVFEQLAQHFGRFSDTLNQGLSQAGETLRAFGEHAAGVGKNLSGNPFKDAWTGIKGLFGKVEEKSVTAANKIERLQSSVENTITKFSGLAISVDATTGKFSTSMQQTGTAVQQTFNSVGTSVNNFGLVIDQAAEKLMAFSGGVPGTQDASKLGGITALFGKSEAAPALGVGGDTGLPSVVTDVVSQSAGQAAKNIDKLGKTSSNTGGKFSGLGEKLTKFSEYASAAMSGISNLIASFTGAKTAAGGALSGGLAGMSAGAAFGPWGAAIGGVGGAITGALFGGKRKKLEDQLKKLDEAFNNVVTSLSLGTTKLGDAIKQLEALRAQAIQQLSSSKKGRKQLPDVLKGFDQQINQLKARQKEILDGLHDQLKVLAAPEMQRDHLNSIDQIIRKYKEFADAAAGNAKEIALANQWLVQSLKNYAQTQMRELNSAEQDAIQNAVSLLDLYERRKEILKDSYEQERNIIARGSVKRFRTESQQKAEELKELREQRAKALKDIDKQIELAETRYNVEKTVFDLSMNRVDMEARLLALQKDQTLLDMERIKALREVIDRLGSGDLSKLTNLDALLKLFGITAPAGTTTPAPAPKPPTRLPDQDGYWRYPRGGVGVYSRASGGSVSSGSTVMMGEEGPELVSFGQDAMIHPNKVYSGILKILSQSRTGRGLLPDYSGRRPVFDEGIRVEQRIHDIAMKRIVTERELLRERNKSASVDIDRIKEMRGLLSDIHRNGGISPSLEGLFSQMFGVRGRYGAGGYYHE